MGFSACRFCNDLVPDEKRVAYGLRHSAHPDCFLKRKGRLGLEKLHLWQLERFPAMVASEHGMLEVIAELIKNHRERGTGTGPR